MSDTTSTTTNVRFMSINEFKIAKGIAVDEKAQVVKNPNSGKLFLSIGSHTFKCQASIDGSKEMKMIVDNGNLDEACLANVKPREENVLFTL